ncbi:MAG TPA: amidohydrolase family protein [Sphingomicrobium sp.]|nr:amidohydrolase family protein [Sphingomicrobium sp.]
MKCAWFGLLSFLTAVQASATSVSMFAVRDVRLFDGEEVRVHQTVIVKHGRIFKVGHNIAIPSGSRIVEGAGRTLLPGLIDAHVHVFPGAQKDALRFGVTTELDMFHNGLELRRWQKQRQQLIETNEADTWSSGVGATAPGGHPSEFGGNFPTIGAAAQAESFVADRVASGSDYIKLFIEDLSEFGLKKTLPTLSKDEVCAVVKAAHLHGKLAIVHAEAEAGAREALDCGADGLAHLFVDQPPDAAFIDEAKRKGIFVITTASVFARQSGYIYSQLLSADRRVSGYLSARERNILLASAGRKMPDFFPNALRSIAMFHAAGIPILAGTDAPNPSVPHGLGLHLELQILVQAGLSPVEALRSATSLPAKVFSLSNRGIIAEGARADMILIRGDPTSEISDTLSIERIWKNGFPVARRNTQAEN